MKKLLLIFYFLFLIKSNLLSQTKTIDVDNKLEVISSISKKIKSSDYLVFNIGNRYMVINKQMEVYKLFFVENRFNVKSQLNNYYIKKTKTFKKSEILDNLFKNYSCSLNDDDNNEYGERYLFFSLTLKSSTVCQFYLPTFYNESGISKIKLPISNETYNYLNSLFIEW